MENLLSQKSKLNILYGVQGTGNGHITRSQQIINLLKKDHNVDVLLSGKQNKLSDILKPTYQFFGFGLQHYPNGKLNFFKTVQNSNLFRLLKDMYSVKFNKYDLVITDFEPISAYGALINNIPSIGISNQNYIKTSSNNFFQKLFLKLFCPAKKNISIHFFQDKSKNVYGPIIDPFLSKETEDNNFVMIYLLPNWDFQYIVDCIKKLSLPNHINHFKVFHPEINSSNLNNEFLKSYPINRSIFVSNLKNCSGIITNCGFSTISEALYLNKKIWLIPLKNQFEQEFNGKELLKKGCFVSNTLDQKHFEMWLNSIAPTDLNLQNSVQDILFDINLYIKNINISIIK